MISKASSTIDSLSRQFQYLYHKLTSSEYPLTAKKISEPNNRFHEYYKKIISNDISEGLIYELQQFNKLLQLINSPKVNIKDSQLSNLVTGLNYRFENQYNDRARNLFFEADFALRFALSSEDFQKIDLSYQKIEDECDIVIDEKIIIECKSISSRTPKKALSSNIIKANKQLITRQNNLNSDSAGIIAMDVTQSIQEDWSKHVSELIYPALQNTDISKLRDDPINNPKLMDTLSTGGYSFLDSWLQTNGVNLGIFQALNLSPNIYSIMIQSDLITFIDIRVADKMEVIQITGRVMIPYNNPLYQGKIKLSDNFQKSLQHFI